MMRVEELAGRRSCALRPAIRTLKRDFPKDV